MNQAKRDPDGIGQRLRIQRRERGMRQQDLGFSASYVSLIERGRRVPPDRVLKRLADAVGCSVEHLRTGRNDSQAKELEPKTALGDMAPPTGDGRRRARIGKALALEGLGRLQPAIALLSELFEDRETLPGSDEEAQIAVALCRCHRDAGELTLSVAIGEQALRHLDVLGLDATNDHWQLVSVLIDCYRLRGDLTQAHKLADRLLATAEQPGSPVTSATVYGNAALYAQDRRRTNGTPTLAERARILMSESDRARHRAMLQRVCGGLLLDSGREEAWYAKQLLEQAQGVLDAVGTTVEQACTDIDLAKVLLRLDEPERAAEYAVRALALLRDQRPRLDAEARTVLAQAQFDCGETDRAHATLSAAEHQLDLLSSARSNSQMWRRIGHLWHRHGMHRQALTAYQKALS